MVAMEAVWMLGWFLSLIKIYPNYLTHKENKAAKAFQPTRRGESVFAAFLFAGFAYRFIGANKSE
jgi:hypothetical protein